MSMFREDFIAMHSRAVSCEGYEQVVRLLLEKGTYVNAQGGYFGSALQAGSYRAHEQVIRLLLGKGSRCQCSSVGLAVSKNLSM